MKKQITLEITGGLIILLFAYASLSKILNFAHFINEINNQPLPNEWTPFLAYTIPAIEIVIVVLLVVPPWRMWGFLLSALFMAVFTVYAAVILMNGFSYVPCSCGGVIELLNWKQHLILNIVFLFLSLLGSWLSFQERKHKRYTTSVGE
ncbi:MAG TPA: MauE/DoxX family redox-associated membrane protein [Puia sp.]|uniref:MauE/DoxX family redox-associated membrane protein n=1 Tax=Puia sp. TaxID=2045100 RepID=UPI002C139EAF|nr:MauE/DoxX family redox-associated membrane protein [Puia sp.]HVU94836.1 MauE/DoxX family redox-associated membrane protein [Puia sp.]